MDRIRQFFEEARIEFKHVNWPTRAEAIRMTGVVIVLSLALAMLLGGFDYIFAQGLSYFIRTFVSG